LPSPLAYRRSDEYMESECGAGEAQGIDKNGLCQVHATGDWGVREGPTVNKEVYA